MAFDELMLEADRSARAEALDVGRSFIVQAPAGSGKTELLIQRYLQLLAEVDQPEEVVAITFTVKAAQEMRLRALSAMRDARDGVAVHEEHQKVTLAAARAVLERDAVQGWELLDSPRRMRVQTMDSLNAGIARSLPFTSGLGSAGRVVTDDEMTSLYRQAAAATLDWLVTEGPENDAVAKVLWHLDNNTGAYISYIARMLARRDQWLAMVGAGSNDPAADAAVRRQLEQNIGAEISSRLERTCRMLPVEQLPLLVSLCGHAAQNLPPEAATALDTLAGCGRFPPTDASCVDLWRSVASLLLTQAGSWRKSVNRTNGFPVGDNGEKKAMLELLRQLEQLPGLAAALHRVRRLPDPRYSDEQWDVLLALFRLLRLAAAELRRLFSERGTTDHTEVAIAAAAAFGSVDAPGDINLLLDHSIRHLLIDEMQDTSIAQYRLVERLVAGWEPGDGRTLFCVGDPMQSIYRFRDAEVGQFLLARTNGIGPVTLEPLLLRRNFRSGERLVGWFNSVFAEVFPAADDVAAGAIAYAHSVPVPPWHGLGDCHIHPLFGVTNEEEADRALEVIERCVNRAQEQSTAVLVRARTQLPLLLARLRVAGIAYQAVEIDRLTDLPEILDLLALSRALAHHGDRIAWLGLLRGPLVGLGWTDLHRLVFNDNDRTVWQILNDDERLRSLPEETSSRLVGFRDTLTAFVAGQGDLSLRERVEQAWFRLRGPMTLRSVEEVENAYRFLDVLESLDVGGTVYDVAELESKLDQERVSSKSAPDCRLHVMTMHKAKGLQFDHVVLYGLGRSAREDEKSILSWLNLPNRSGEAAMLISPVGARAALRGDPLHSFIEATERAKSRLERDRLLYVACTRARRSLHLMGHVTLSPDGNFRAPRKSSLLNSLWPMLEPDFRRAFATRVMPPGPPAHLPEEPSWRLPELRCLRPGVALPDPAPMPGPAADPRGEAAAEQAVDFYWVGSIARHAGTIVHRWLQRIATGRLQVEPDKLDTLLPAARKQATELGVPLRDQRAVCERALEALRGILGDERGNWILSGGGYAEMPISGLWNGKIHSVVLDRVRIDADGTHWIIDYKASTHEGGALERFLQQESERYRAQLARYAALYRSLGEVPGGVRTALYFPLLQEFFEVEVA